MKSNILMLLPLFIILPFKMHAQDEWQSLFNGQNLEGWFQLGGGAKYFVEDGAIVGEAVPNTPNSFLATEQDYGDFILEYEVYLDTQINSGVQIRSNSDPDYRNGRVHGYQVELDPSDRAWTGGIYDEARRGWLYPLTHNQEAGSAFRNGSWNKIRVEAIGPSINVWVNGVQTSKLMDDMTAEGFIALQVHSIHDERLVGAQIKWRNIRIRTSDLEDHRTTPDPDVRLISYL